MLCVVCVCVCVKACGGDAGKQEAEENCHGPTKPNVHQVDHSPIHNTNK